MPTKYDISTRTARRNLPPRREPYFIRIEAGAYLGYRKSAKDEHGQWVARWRNAETGKQHFKSLGWYQDIDPARKAAIAWFEHCKGTGKSDSLTVSEVVKHYIDSLRQTGRNDAAKDAEYRLNAFITDHPIGRLTMDKLKAKHLNDWRDSLEGKAATVNRSLTTLRAALNLARNQDLIQSDAAWRGVKHIQTNDAISRDRWLNQDERDRLLEACGPHLRQFVAILLLTAARPGEIASAIVGDLDAAAGTLKLDGKTGKRDIPLSSAALELCREVKRDKLPSAPLFSDPSGKPWNKSVWCARFRTACEAADLGNDVVLYSLRHTAISEMIQAGMDAFTVARMAGTSTAMIDKHYGHLAAHRTRAQLDQVRLA